MHKNLGGTEKPIQQSRENLNTFIMKELEKDELMKVDGGFVPLVIFGVLYSAEIVAAACGASFLAGFAGGIAIATALD